MTFWWTSGIEGLRIARNKDCESKVLLVSYVPLKMAPNVMKIEEQKLSKKKSKNQRNPTHINNADENILKTGYFHKCPSNYF